MLEINFQVFWKMDELLERMKMPLGASKNTVWIFILTNNYLLKFKWIDSMAAEEVGHGSDSLFRTYHKVTGAWCSHDSVDGGSRLAHGGAASFLMFSNVGVFGVQNKMEQIAHWVVYNHFRSCMSWIQLFFLKELCFVAFITDPSRVKLPSTSTY